MTVERSSKERNTNFGHVIPAKSDPSNHCCRNKKSFLGLQYVQELWLLWQMGFTTIKNQPCKLASSTRWVSSSLSNQGQVLRSLYAGLYESEIAAV